MPKYEGKGKKLKEALAAAATEATQKDPGNDDQWFDVKVSVQITRNPGIKEYKVEIVRP